MTPRKTNHFVLRGISWNPWYTFNSQYFSFQICNISSNIYCKIHRDCKGDKKIARRHGGPNPTSLYAHPLSRTYPRSVVNTSTQSHTPPLSRTNRYPVVCTCAHPPANPRLHSFVVVWMHTRRCLSCPRRRALWGHSAVAGATVVAATPPPL